ncbi:MAG: FeS cluster assembly protein SufD [Phycisphaerae bacterium]|nr:FeS cluster assembly protein SufD [Phycisphaerae bacterium]
MNMATVEQQLDHYQALYQRRAGQLTGGQQNWFSAVRQAAWVRFEQEGWPTTQHEQWRFTRLQDLAAIPFQLAVEQPQQPLDQSRLRSTLSDSAVLRVVVVNGRLHADASTLDRLPRGLRIGSLGAALQSSDPVVQAHLHHYLGRFPSPLAQLNTALFEDGVFIHLAAGQVIEQPIQIIYCQQGAKQPLLIQPRTLVVLEANSQLRLMEHFVGTSETVYLNNVVTEVVVADLAVLDYYRLVQENEAAYQLSTLGLHQGRNSTITATLLNLGGRLVRNDLSATLAGEGADCVLNGLTVLHNRQHTDHHLWVEHTQPHCHSWEYFKGVYDDHAHGVFAGCIHVYPGAQKTDAKQTNMNLLLSDQALVDSKPQLEIFADDVKCTHGATIGQIDPEALFYLRSRGLSEVQARHLLVFAFANEILQQMKWRAVAVLVERELVQRLQAPELAGVEM